MGNLWKAERKTFVNDVTMAAEENHREGMKQAETQPQQQHNTCCPWPHRSNMEPSWCARALE